MMAGIASASWCEYLFPDPVCRCFRDWPSVINVQPLFPATCSLALLCPLKQGYGHLSLDGRPGFSQHDICTWAPVPSQVRISVTTDSEINLPKRMYAIKWVRRVAVL
jgi:hypothetical protein